MPPFMAGKIRSSFRLGQSVRTPNELAALEGEIGGGDAKNSWLSLAEAISGDSERRWDSAAERRASGVAGVD